MAEIDDLPTEEELTAIEEATVTVYGLKAGHTLTEDEVKAIAVFDEYHRQIDDEATNAFHRGYQAGLKRGAGANTADLINRAEAASSALGVEKALRKFDHIHGFQSGAAACREMIARFVEQGGDATTAASIRANWHPGWGENRPAPEGEIPVPFVREAA